MKKYLTTLQNTPLFTGLDENEIMSVLQCVDASIIKKSKDTYLLRSGDTTDTMGLVLAGSTLIIQEDIWGHRNILSRCNSGDFFGEPYAATPNSILNVSVIAESDCEVLMLNVRRLLSTCSMVCEHHQKLIRNLTSVLANKILIFNDKITHISKRSTRAKLLSYLSAESMRQKSLSFDIPYDRQKLADFLCVERAAMSVELSKLQKEGILKTKRNHFELNCKIDPML